MPNNTDNKNDAATLLKNTLRRVANASTVTGTERMRAALALATLERDGLLDDIHVAASTELRIAGIINGSK